MMRVALILIVSVVCAAVVGCRSNRHRDASEAPRPSEGAVVTLPITPGDELEVKFYYAPELNLQQVVRPDGKIAMQLIGDVRAAGRSPAELSEELRALYATQLRTPEVTVIVRRSFARRVYVTGEVDRPGVVEMPGPLSLWEAVITAGGFSMRNADRGQVIVARVGADGKRVGYAVDMTGEMEGAATVPFMLEPMDIVYVAREPIVNVGEFIDKYINQMVPQTGFVITERRGNTTIGLDTSGR